jgi:ferrous iron transport protein A
MQRRYQTIADLKVNESARTISFADQALACKLTSMGFLPGTRVELVRKAPFGNAYYVKADGVRMALREEEALNVLLEL